jgi:sugar phosphate isomerase/epimerase
VLTRRAFGHSLLAVPLAGAVPLAIGGIRLDSGGFRADSGGFRLQPEGNTAQQPRPGVARFASRFSGVRVGAQTYCYRSLRDTAQPWSAAGVDALLDKVVGAFVQNQIDLAEFWIALVEPPGGPGRGPADPVMRQGLRDWRKSRPLDVFERARRKFTDAGIEIYSCMYNFADDLADDELEFAFDVAKTLGTTIISANCTKASIKRAAAAADRHKVYVSAHAENAPFDRNPDGMVYGKNLVEALSYSPYIKVTLDTGHFTAFGGDAVAFVREHHARIANLHLKDRLRRAEDRNDQNTTEWGKGDAPLVEVLQLMREQRYPFPACIEYEYAGKGTAVEEVQKCLDYARAALISPSRS